MKSFVFINMIFKKIGLSVLIVVFFLSSCVENSGLRSKVNGKTSSNSSTPTNSDTTTSVPIGTTTTLQSVRVELSHLVDPFDGTYKKKVTLPKNYKGNFYIAGLNISALQSKLIKVRFNFGLENQPVVLNATVARAPGIVPQTETQVLVVDMSAKPFSRMRLGYDLFDYNDYSETDSTSANYLEPVSDPRNNNLYCRGLKLENDPSYDNTKTTLGCNTTTDKCLYAYAKIADTTLYTTNNASTGLTSIPTRPQVWTETSSRSPSLAVSASSMCLPDSSDPLGLATLYNDSAITSLLENSSLQGMFYRGPYRAINSSQWQIQQDAIFNQTTGLFKETSYVNYKTGWKSLLFPIAGKLTLNQGVIYQGSDDRFSVRGNKVVDSTGITKYVDGCNIRVREYNPATTEGISSCNVNGSIEIFYMKDNAEVLITKDTNIKLQLIRPSELNFEGKEVLASAFKRCESSSTCGTDECCFNSRCWSKDLVTQCVDKNPIIGNQEIGANCSSDYECSSLCCNQSTGSCSPHNPNGASPILCSKTSGEKCVSREFCKPSFVATCKIYKLSTLKPDGSPMCALRCPLIETYGQCTSGQCVPPVTPPVPAFDPNDCSQAVDP